MSKEYSGAGSGHGPVYASAADQEWHVARSTQEAFAYVFDQILTDVKGIETR